AENAPRLMPMPLGAHDWKQRASTPSVDEGRIDPCASQRAKLSMEASLWRVVKGEPLDEGAVVTFLVSDEHVFTLSPEEEATLLESIAEANRGELIDVQDVLKRPCAGFRSFTVYIKGSDIPGRHWRAR